MASRLVGSPNAVRRAERERNQGLQHMREEIEAGAAKQHMEAGVRAHMDRLREEKMSFQANSVVENMDALQRLEGMDGLRLRCVWFHVYACIICVHNVHTHL